MALSAAPGLAAYSISASVKKLDLSEELAEIIRTDNTALLQRVGAAGLVATQLKHSWPRLSFSHIKVSYLFWEVLKFSLPSR